MSHILFVLVSVVLCSYVANAQIRTYLPPEKITRFVRIVPIHIKDNSLPEDSNYTSFDDFIAKTGRIYYSEAEYRFREKMYDTHQNMVVNMNKGSAQRQYKCSLNAFSDLTEREYIRKLTGVKKTMKGEARRKNETVAYSLDSARSDSLPDSFDWRIEGGVTPVKFQGTDCGGCWAFTVTGAIEGHVFRKTGELKSLSEQNLIDCSSEYGNEGCDGGFQEYGFEYVKENGGIALSSSYRNVLTTDNCHYMDTERGASIIDYEVIATGDELKLKEVVATLGPVACSMNANPKTFLLYESGIYMDNSCNQGEPNHSILVVGYDTDDRGQDYWIIKNAWSSKWGENGYFRLPRGNNYCSIATECSYPIV